MSQLKTDCPTFTIHLDAPPERRWTQVIEHYKEYIPEATNVACDLLGKNTVKLLTPMLNLAFNTNQIIYKNELLAIANQVSIEPGLLLLLQLVYESFAACTSVIVRTKTHPIHIRTMDWDLPILRKLTFQGKFKIKNKTIFIGTSWAGYIGILTGMRYKQNKKQESFSVSINYRQTVECYKSPYAQYLRNIYRTITGCWPVSYLVREVLTHSHDYDIALKHFRSEELISPTYITICGEKTRNGAIITRNRSTSEPIYINKLYLCSKLVQANMDHFDDNKYEKPKKPKKDFDLDIMDSRYRYSYVNLALNSSSPPDINKLYKIMCMPPCYSRELNIYTCAMIPAEKFYKTMVKRNPKIYKQAKAELAKTVRYAKRF